MLGASVRRAWALPCAAPGRFRAPRLGASVRRAWALPCAAPGRFRAPRLGASVRRAWALPCAAPGRFRAPRLGASVRRAWALPCAAPGRFRAPRLGASVRCPLCVPAVRGEARLWRARQLPTLRVRRWPALRRTGYPGPRHVIATMARCSAGSSAARRRARRASDHAVFWRKPSTAPRPAEDSRGASASRWIAENQTSSGRCVPSIAVPCAA